MAQRRSFALLQGTIVERYGPGNETSDVQPGDFILTHENDLFARLIRVGQALRFIGRDRKYTYWNHTALIVGKDGTLIEALSNGVSQTHISKYKSREYYLVRLGTTANNIDRNQAATFARWSCGEKYGWLTLLSIAIALLTGGRLTFGYEGQEICSGLVARALERTDAIFDRNPKDMMPADLAKYYQVEPLYDIQGST